LSVWWNEDTLGSKPSDLKIMGVQLPLRTPKDWLKFHI
jgi:hypothetical protein